MWENNNTLGILEVINSFDIMEISDIFKIQDIMETWGTSKIWMLKEIGKLLSCKNWKIWEIQNILEV